MISRPFAAIAATAAALTLTSCGGGGGTGPDARTVTVVGQGEVRTAPDVLSAEVGVSTNAPDVGAAVDRANERAQAIIEAVGGLGVAKEDIRTSQFSVSQDFTGPNSTPSGYRVTNMVTVLVRDLDKASDVIDAAVRAGGDDARINSVQFTLENDSEAIKQARERAFNDAKQRAEQYADLSGLGLGDVVTIDEQTSSGSQPPVAFDASERLSVPLEPGTQTVSFQVTVKWGLN